jgi:hypothetical protein
MKRLLFTISLLFAFEISSFGQPSSIVNRADTNIFLPYQNGVAPFSYKGKMGIIDSLGKVIIPRSFTRLSMLFNADEEFSYRFYYNKKKVGVLDTAFNIIISAGIYDDINVFVNGFFIVKKGRSYTFVNNKGIELGKWFKKVGYFGKIGLANVQDKNHWGYINPKGEMIINAKFDKAYTFCENGLARVKVNGKWGFINPEGLFVIPPIYDKLGCFSNELASAQKGTKCGYIDSLGQVIISFEYSSADAFDNFGMTCVRKNGRFGFINKQNEVVLPFQYFRAHSFGDNNQNTMVRLKRLHHSIWINRKGECVYWCD